MEGLLMQYEYFKSRSVFYNLKPIGVGTGEVESLTSFITRLCRVHRISVNSLFLYFYNKDIISKKILFSVKNSHRINRVHSPYTQEVACALNKLTHQNDIDALLLPLASRDIYGKNVKTYKSWCPMCFRDDQTKLTGAYDRLLWNLRFVRICHIHDCLLETKCPECYKENPVLSSEFRVDHCHYCNSKLSDALPIDIQTLWIDEIYAQEIIVEQMLLLLSINQFEKKFINCFHKGYLKIDVLSEKSVKVIKEIFGVERRMFMKNYLERNGIYHFFKDTGKDPGLKDMWFFSKELYRFRRSNRLLYEKLFNKRMYHIYQ
ncbi:TniQ family protein [Bacillus thuringiensis]|uniref:TniQ family protein n=1 Tax=Bacillus thuringiensis TaxID=1428 RepID=UPI0015F34B3D|nr:TniQ family protein [Bacillus thuringiensis]MDZ3954836.1 TniQ family protein [Bacillus thuringiensis]